MENNNPTTEQVASRKDVYQMVTDTIIQQLEAGTVPWQKPWEDGVSPSLNIPQNYTTGNLYRGINILLLWSASIINNYSSSEWATFNQWNQKKEFIRKGEKGSMIVYYDTFEKEVDGEKQNIPFIKTSVVFNRSQLSGYVPETTTKSEKPLFEIIYPVEEFVLNTGATIDNNHNRACYKTSADMICMPSPDTFITTGKCTATEAYYSTLMHELTHWTGNKQRLNREGGKKFGDQQYAFEELVAELGAAFLCAGFEMATVETGNHASYIANWLQVLRDNKHFVIKAASEASKAVDYLNTLQV